MTAPYMLDINILPPFYYASVLFLHLFNWSVMMTSESNIVSSKRWPTASPCSGQTVDENWPKYRTTR